MQTPDQTYDGITLSIQTLHQVPTALKMNSNALVHTWAPLVSAACFPDTSPPSSLYSFTCSPPADAKAKSIVFRLSGAFRWWWRCCFETVSYSSDGPPNCCVTRDDLGVWSSALPHEQWDYRIVPPHLVYELWRSTQALCMLDKHIPTELCPQPEVLFFFFGSLWYYF